MDRSDRSKLKQERKGLIQLSTKEDYRFSTTPVSIPGFDLFISVWTLTHRFAGTAIGSLPGSGFEVGRGGIFFQEVSSTVGLADEGRGLQMRHLPAWGGREGPVSSQSLPPVQVLRSWLLPRPLQALSDMQGQSGTTASSSRRYGKFGLRFDIALPQSYRFGVIASKLSHRIV